MKKKVFAVALTVCMVAGLMLTGCGGSSGGGGADGGKTVKLGFLSPITGANAAEGAAARNAFKLAIDQANESGDFDYTIEMIEIDDKSDPSTGVAGAQKIVSDPDVVAATGHWNTCGKAVALCGRLAAP